MILPDSLPPAPSVYNDFRDLTKAADEYLNENCTPQVRSDRVKEVSQLLETEGQIYQGRPVILSGLLKKADFPKTGGMSLAGQRHLEESRVFGVASGFVIVDLERDFDDVKDKSPRQEKIYSEIVARSVGRFATGYLVDVARRGIISTDYLQRDIQTRSVFGLASSSVMTLQDHETVEDHFGIEDQTDAEASRILQISSDRTHAVLSYVEEQLRKSDNVLQTLADHTAKIQKSIRPGNDLELGAIADILSRMVEEEIIGKVYEFEGKLPVSLILEGGSHNFVHIDPSTGNRIYVNGISCGPRYEITPDGLYAATLNSPGLFVQCYMVYEGSIDATPLLIPLEELKNCRYQLLDEKS